MDKKALIAIIICGVVMLVYYPFILPMFSPKKTKPAEEMKEEVVSEKRADMKAEAEQQPMSKPSIQTIPPQIELPIQEVTIENELLKMVWSNEGAALKSIKLKHFKDAEAKDILELLKDTYTEYHPLAIDTFAQKTKFQRQRYNILEHSANKIVFTTKLEEGINIIKTIDLPSHKYNINMDIALENTTDTEVSFSYNIIASSMITHEGEPSTDMAAVAGVDLGNNRTKLAHTAPKEFPFKNESVGIVWAGSTNKYFATILKPVSSDSVASINAQAFDVMGALTNEKADTGDFMVSLQTNKFRIPPQQSVKHSYLYFM
ncbi:MAG: membrane protein insertase YidC, partial [Planctomycetota bacterium]